jgi:hypothetical protein
MSGYLSFGQIILNTLLVRRFGRFPAVLLLILSLAACGGGGGGDKPNNPPPPPPPPPPPSSGFAEITNATGVDFAVGYSENPGDVPLVNFIAGGAAAGDYDDDGDIDLFVVRGDVGPNLLYRNVYRCCRGSRSAVHEIGNRKLPPQRTDVCRHGR